MNLELEFIKTLERSRALVNQAKTLSIRISRTLHSSRKAAAKVGEGLEEAKRMFDARDSLTVEHSNSQNTKPPRQSSRLI